MGPHFFVADFHNWFMLYVCKTFICCLIRCAVAGTQYFLETGSLDQTAVRGRWQNVKTCRIYIDEALRDKPAMDIKRPKLIRKAAKKNERLK